MDTLQILHPDEISETPFPNQEETSGVSQPSTTSGGVISTTKIKDNPFPRKVIAHETIASSLNTKTKKILGQYEFAQQGAIQVGKYENGVSGDMRLSPDGITARNNAGTTTFAIDGDTGDATFKGNVQAGAFFVGSTVAVEESSSGNGRIVLYNDGLPSILIGDPD